MKPIRNPAHRDLISHINTKLTEELIDQICLPVNIGLPAYRAAQRVGITGATLAKWMKKGEEVLEMICDSRDPMDYVERLPTDLVMAVKLVTKIMMARANGEAGMLRKLHDSTAWQAQAWILERTNQEDYGVKIAQKTEVTVKDDRDLDKLTDEELDARIKEIEERQGKVTIDVEAEEVVRHRKKLK